jgi:hypothetical protein
MTSLYRGSLFWLTCILNVADYEALRPRLKVLMQAHTVDVEQAASLEKRIAALMERHATHV